MVGDVRGVRPLRAVEQAHLEHSDLRRAVGRPLIQDRPVDDQGVRARCVGKGGDVVGWSTGGGVDHQQHRVAPAVQRRRCGACRGTVAGRRPCEHGVNVVVRAELAGPGEISPVVGREEAQEGVLTDVDRGAGEPAHERVDVWRGALDVRILLGELHQAGDDLALTVRGHLVGAAAGQHVEHGDERLDVACGKRLRGHGPVGVVGAHWLIVGSGRPSLPVICS